jgi:hypothetical protein
LLPKSVVGADLKEPAFFRRPHNKRINNGRGNFSEENNGHKVYDVREGVEY